MKPLPIVKRCIPHKRVDIATKKGFDRWLGIHNWTQAQIDAEKKNN